MTQLLIDGDLLAFRAASATEKVVDLCSEDSKDPEMWITWASPSDLMAAIDSMYHDIVNDAARFGKVKKFDSVKVYLTDESKPNWRKSVFKDYKANRKDVRKPTGLYFARQYVRQEFGCYETPGLEADDLIGMEATKKENFNKVIFASGDKDFHSIPGKFYNFLSKTLTFNSIDAADAFHMYQTIAGDAVDGYSGVPGLGKTFAEAFVKEPYKLVPKEKVLSRGKNKGNTVIEWVKSEEFSSMWECVLSLYEKAGLDEKYALEQARVARILRHGEYDWDTGEIELWNP